MSVLTKRVAVAGIAVTIASAVLLSAVAPADAGYRYRRGYHGGWGYGGAAVGGLVAGALIGSALAAPRYYAPPAYYAPPPVYYAPPPPRYYAPPVRVFYQPWTPEWYRYCSARYRSFNPRTGYFLAYSGRYVFCR